MSYLSGFFRLCVGDGSTQRMVKGEDKVGSRGSEDSSSTSSEDAPSRVDAFGVIT